MNSRAPFALMVKTKSVKVARRVLNITWSCGVTRLLKPTRGPLTLQSKSVEDSNSDSEKRAILCAFHN